jgi:hypothetical protein
MIRVIRGRVCHSIKAARKRATHSFQLSRHLSDQPLSSIRAPTPAFTLDLTFMLAASFLLALAVRIYTSTLRFRFTVWIYTRASAGPDSGFDLHASSPSSN